MHAKYLQKKLMYWIESEDILIDEQAGFRTDQSKLDHAMVLQCLVL